MKAIAFCPWSRSLLATGAGAKDRTIRFWHSFSGTLIKFHFTGSQITSLIWSKTTKQIVATFGFGNTQTLLNVYSYETMKCVSRVSSSSGELRILGATLSPDCSSLCVATNESTIRIYKLWKPKTFFTRKLSQKQGTFGSSLIELLEGVDKSEFSLR